MSTFFPLLVLALAAALLHNLLHRDSPAFALLLSLGASVVILFRVGGAAVGILNWLSALQSRLDSPAFSALLRTAGILLLSDYVGTVCREAGAASVGWCTDLAGRCMALVCLWPMLQEITNMIRGLTG